MFDFIVENGIWTLGCLIATALVIAMLEDYFQKFWKAPPVKVPDNPLKNPSAQSVHRIVSPNHTYELGAHIASGDLCDVHLAHSGDSKTLLKIARVPGGEALMAKEFSILTRLHKQSADQVYREYFPKPIESFSHDSRQINAYSWQEGFFTWQEGFYTAEQILDRHHQGLDGRHLGWMVNRMLEALGFVHQEGFLHGAVLPPHVLFHAEGHGLLLVGWIHAERENTSLKVVPERFKDWYPPECHRNRPATPSVDLYLAAKTVIYLAGGDPVLNWFPEHVPIKMQRFLKSCLLESPAMRPQNAWELRREFGQMLEGLYGPPAFHPLDMS